VTRPTGKASIAILDRISSSAVHADSTTDAFPYARSAGVQAAVEVAQDRVAHSPQMARADEGI